MVFMNHIHINQKETNVYTIRGLLCQREQKNISYIKNDTEISSRVGKKGETRAACETTIW